MVAPPVECRLYIVELKIGKRFMELELIDFGVLIRRYEFLRSVIIHVVQK